MNNLHRVRTDWAERYHLLVDADAPRYTAFRVELWPHAPIVVGNPDMTEAERVHEAMETLRWLRTQASKSWPPSSDFIPFARIIAIDHDDARRARAVEIQMLIGQDITDACNGADGLARVRALCTALDLLHGGRLPMGRTWN